MKGVLLDCSLANVTMTMLDNQTAFAKPTTAPSFVRIDLDNFMTVSILIYHV